uniref:Uncharacterized protein n=1 Tax=Toxoplasma gondii (strain ATCC 50861 / VEG) TaxID=432359 RepID=A0A0F7V4U7_TOXGV|nr:TPA: hypothetical protein BN1205_081230 [Toxoplasma gondii VEG]
MNAPGTFVLAGNRSQTASANEQVVQKKQYGEFLRQQIAAEKQREFLSKMQRQSPLPGPLVSSSHDAYDMGAGLDRTRALSYASVLPMPARASDNFPHMDPQMQFAGEPSFAGWNTGTVQNLYPVASASYSARGLNPTAVPYVYGAFPNGLGAPYAPNSLLPQSTSVFRSHPVYSQALYPTTTSHSLEVQSCGVIPETSTSSLMLQTNTRRDRIEGEERNRAVAMPTTNLDSENVRPVLSSCAPLDTDRSHSQNKVQDKPVTLEEQKLREKRDYGEFLKTQIALRKQRERTERALSLGTNDLPGNKQRGYAPSVSVDCGGHQSGQEREASREPSSSLSRSPFGLGQSGNAADNIRWGTHEENVTARLKQQREYGEFLKKQAELKKLERDRQKEQELAEDKKLLEIAHRMEIYSNLLSSSRFSSQLTDSASNYPVEARRRGRNRINLQAFEGLNVAFGGCKTARAENVQNDLGSIYSEKTGSPPVRKPDGADFSNGERNSNTGVQSHHLQTAITAKKEQMNETCQDGGRVPKNMFNTGSMNGGIAEGAWDDHEIRHYQKLSSKKLYQQALEEQIREKEARREKEKQERLKEQAEERRLLDEAFQQEKRTMRLGRRPAKSFEEDAAFRAPLHLKASDASPIQGGEGGQSSSSAGTTVAVTPPPQASQPYCRRDTGVANSDEQNGCLNREPPTVDGKDVVAYWKPGNEDKRQRVPESVEKRPEALVQKYLQLVQSVGVHSSDSSENNQDAVEGATASALSHVLLGNSILRLLAPILVQLLEEQKQRTCEETKDQSDRLTEERGDSESGQKLDHGGCASRGRSERSVKVEDGESLPREHEGDDIELPRRRVTRTSLVPAVRTTEQCRCEEHGERGDGRISCRNAENSEADCVPGDVRSRFIRIDDVIDSFAQSLTTETRSRGCVHSCTSISSSSPSAPSPCFSCGCYARHDEDHIPAESYDLSLSTEYSNAFGNASASVALRVSSAGSSKARGHCRLCSESRCPSRETERYSCHTQGSHDHGVNLEKLPQAIRCRFLAIRNLDNLAAPTFSLEDSSCTSPASDHDTVVEPASPPVPVACSPAFLGGIPTKPPPRLWRKAFSLSMSSLSKRLGLAPRGPSVERQEVTDHFKRRETNGSKAEQEVPSSPGTALLEFIRTRGAQIERIRRTGEPLTLVDRFRSRLTWEEDVMRAVRADDGPLNTVTQVLENIPEEETDTKQTRKNTKPTRWGILRSAVKLGRRISRKRISFAPETKQSLESSDENSGMGEDKTEKKRGR